MIVLLMAVAAFIAAAMLDQPVLIGIGLVLLAYVCYVTIKNRPRR